MTLPIRTTRPSNHSSPGHGSAGNGGPGSHGHAHQLLLYRRPLHPELFPPKARRVIQHGQYELEAWIMPSGHVMRFRFGAFNACELVIPQETGLPVEGAVTAMPCAGEHEFEHVFEPERVTYMTSVQTETLPENLYNATYEEMLEFAAEIEALIFRWRDPAGGENLSMLDVQRMNKEVHGQAYHLVAASGLVVRTQSIFEHR